MTCYLSCRVQLQFFNQVKACGMFIRKDPAKPSARSPPFLVPRTNKEKSSTVKLRKCFMMPEGCGKAKNQPGGGGLKLPSEARLWKHNRRHIDKPKAALKDVDAKKNQAMDVQIELEFVCGGGCCVLFKRHATSFRVHQVNHVEGKDINIVEGCTLLCKELKPVLCACFSQ